MLTKSQTTATRDNGNNDPRTFPSPTLIYIPSPSTSPSVATCEGLSGMIEEKDTVGDTAAGRDVEKNNLDGSDFASRAFSGDRPSTRLWSRAAPMLAASSQAKSRPCSNLFLPIQRLAPLEEGSLKVEAPPTATSTIPEKKTGKKGKGKKSRPKSTRGSG